MRYLVDLEKKQVMYDESFPAGHLIALKKIFESQGYEFSECKEIKTVVELSAEMSKELRESGLGRPIGHSHTSMSKAEIQQAIDSMKHTGLQFVDSGSKVDTSKGGKPASLITYDEAGPFPTSAMKEYMDHMTDINTTLLSSVGISAERHGYINKPVIESYRMDILNVGDGHHKPAKNYSRLHDLSKTEHDLQQTQAEIKEYIATVNEVNSLKFRP